MNKLIVSASLVTLGATGLQAAYAPGLSPMETSKPWSVAATLRGFYDDNYNNAPAHVTPGSGIPTAKSSPGLEFSPSARLNFPMEQTYIGVGLVYSLKDYFDRPGDTIDHQVEATLKLDHRLSELYKVSFDDSFVYSSEPEVAGATLASFQRQDASYLRNRAKIDFNGHFTEALGFEASYGNTWYDYLQEELAGFPNGSGSLSARLDRFEHLFDFKGTWQVQEHLTGLLGYQFGITDYTSDKFVIPFTPPAGPLNPVPARGSDRDTTSHYVYVGVEHAFTSQFNGSVEIGYQHTSYELGHQSASSPYAELRATYTYLPGSSVQFGLTHTRNATDQVGSGTASGLTLDQESTSVFASVSHRITARITGNAVVTYQHSTANGGTIDGSVDNFVLLGLNLQYRINNNWLTEIGYNLDNLDSDQPDRSFTRNRIYAGVTANF